MRLTNLSYKQSKSPRVATTESDNEDINFLENLKSRIEISVDSHGLLTAAYSFDTKFNI